MSRRSAMNENNHIKNFDKIYHIKLHSYRNIILEIFRKTTVDFKYTNHLHIQQMNLIKYRLA